MATRFVDVVFWKKNFFVVSVPLHPDLHDLPSQNHSRACTWADEYGMLLGALGVPGSNLPGWSSTVDSWPRDLSRDLRTWRAHITGISTSQARIAPGAHWGHWGHLTVFIGIGAGRGPWIILDQVISVTLSAISTLSTNMTTWKMAQSKYIEMLDLPSFQMVIFHSYVTVYQRLYQVHQRPSNSPSTFFFAALRPMTHCWWCWVAGALYRASCWAWTQTGFFGRFIQKHIEKHHPWRIRLVLVEKC